MRSIERGPRTSRFVRLAGLAALMITTSPALVSAQGAGGPAGADIKIRAINQSTSDTPFCAVGGGLLGDRLDVDVFMDQNGHVTGTARFEAANHVVTTIDVNRLFSFGSGLVAQDQTSQNTVAIWLTDELALAGFLPSMVNVELPRGCLNTQSTFTPGVDKITMEIKFR